MWGRDPSTVRRSPQKLQIWQPSRLPGLQLNLFDAARASSVSRRELRAPGVADLLDQLDFEAAALVEPLTGRAPEVVSDWPGGWFYSSLGLLGAGVVAVGAGAAVAGVGVLLFESFKGSNELRLGARGVAWVGLLTAVVVGPLLLGTGLALAGSSWVLDE